MSAEPSTVRRRCTFTRITLRADDRVGHVEGARQYLARSGSARSRHILRVSRLQAAGASGEPRSHQRQGYPQVRKVRLSGPEASARGAAHALHRTGTRFHLRRFYGGKRSDSRIN